MAGDAFTAGVKPGGLTNGTEIRILLCYLIKSTAPVSREIIQHALLEEQLVNYFELSSSLDDLVNQQLVTVDGPEFSITKKGITVADNLAFDLPKSVRESAIRAVLRVQAWARKAAENQAEIRRSGAAYFVDCAIHEHGQQLFSLSVSVPDHLIAEKVRDSFVENGPEIYSLFIQKLIEK